MGQPPVKPNRAQIQARREANRRRVAKHKAQQRAGFACYTVPIHEEVLDAMVRWGWLTDAETHDKAKVASTISKELLVAARTPDENF